MSNIGIVVSRASKIVRRVVVPTASESEIGTHPLDPAEQMLIVGAPQGLLTPDLVADLVQRATGVTPPSSRCALVVKANAVSGHVANIVHADPSIDLVSGFTLMPHATAQAGWTWSAAQGLQPST